MNRRAILRGIAAAPLAGHAAAEQAKLSLAGITSVLPDAAGTTGSLVGSRAPEPLQFRDFAQWMREHGERHARERAQHVSALDPDLVEMRLPLNTKVWMQRQRNYKRIAEEQREAFDAEVLMRGFFKWWP